MRDATPPEKTGKDGARNIEPSRGAAAAERGAESANINAN